MKINTKYITLSTNGDTDIIDITDDVQKTISHAGMKDGIVTIFITGSTAGLTTVEYEPGLIKDLKVLFEKIAPKGVKYAHDAAWGDGNGHAHIRSSLIGPCLTVPFVKGNLALGTWQQIIFIDFDNRPRNRKLVLQIIGE